MQLHAPEEQKIKSLNGLCLYAYEFKPLPAPAQKISGQFQIESLRDIFADIPDQLDGARPFSQRRGQLSAPVPGRVLTAFGGSLPDGRRSEGWLLEAAAGETVTAVAPGRVAFSDWMNGYGLLLILDHGEGFLSLYAHNDGLMREVGDWVKAGEPLAQAGSSGGQGRAALYFELRRQGQPLDPQLWLRR